ncbi:Regulator of chromosome condensation (RCC1) family with FYVE zinc finger domain-containing protein [Citrus sinensis]|uniref:Regulator of chromosome condensation (RCC1) family with FYVE zinc finger domain-containing protein n=1 Tax=Citrus sinensis TaxID=2711 RepID=A0ACB8IQA2_CITSI|nr:Regulator of chromosome condensation (RCC1) family with FYVE zinc finger domain-containing protein [Citrus sinensis]
MATTGAAAAPVERDIELAITALKKGAHLLKYGRRGKPKFCPFRLANDESILIWISGKEEKHLKLSHVSRIIPGQRTPIFQRYPRPEKEYQSFSLIYNDRSLDLICKDKDEAEVWFTGLKALISRSHYRKGRAESRTLSDAVLYAAPPKVLLPSESACGSVNSLSSGGSDGRTGHLKGLSGDTFRVSLSSAVSSSSQGSGHDDGDSLGDVFIWGECTGDGILGGGIHRSGSYAGVKMDSFVPKAVESAVVLDVQNIACGGRHAALVTKQGEVFSWGEELGGRLGHGVDSDVSHPKLIDALKNINVELVACGEHHTCAVTLSGDMYTWGGSNCNFGLLGHGNEMSLWLPKKLNGPLEGIHVSSVSCGPWHTAVVTSAGQLFTFGDGTFGVLGHGDRISVSTPREVDSLKGLRTVRAACGVWHTAAVVEVMVGSSSSSNCSSGKLFTWGDGDRGRLGHGDKEARLVPTCVAALVEPNFCQVSCGHSLTVALTTTGHVYTMGSPVYGQLGDPKANGKLPTRVEGKLTKNFVEEIACGDYHVAVLTSRTEVYTWGKGANGRLGHGDTDDRNFPSLVEALKDKQVKSIVCGTSFTAAICLHKWVSGVDQSMCSGCRIPFNFKRKRHNCYNCGLVYCHTCSSKKSVKASMAPNPNKPYRVCDNCFGKLTKATETSSSSHSTVSRRGSMNQGFNEAVEHGENFVSRSHVQFGTSMESLKKVESGSSKRNKKQEFNRTRGLPLPNGVSQGNALNNSKSSNPVFGSTKKFFSASLPGSRIMSRATSPTSRRSSPPRATTPTPTLSGLASPKIVVDDAKRTSEEVIKLRAQVEELTRKSQLQEIELERTTRQLKEALAVAGEETAKCRAAKDVIKSLTAQLKDMAEMLPVGAVRNSNSFHSSPTPAWDVSSAAIEQPSSPLTFQGAIPNGSNSLILSNGSDFGDNRSPSQTEASHCEATTKNKNRTMKAEPAQGDEWVEQDETGVYITLVALPGGLKDLKRVRFSRKKFSEKQAEQWWAANRARVYQQYNVSMVDKSSISIGREGLAH